MKKFFRNTCFLALLSLSMPSVFCAIVTGIIQEVEQKAAVVIASNVFPQITLDLERITGDLPTASLPFSACELDFSNFVTGGESIIKLCTAVVSAHPLTEPHILYLISEGLAAESRRNPSILGEVSQFLNEKTSTNRNAIYNGFKQINDLISTEATIESIFASQESCDAFVMQTAKTLLPGLLKAIGASDNVVPTVVKIEDVVVPDISKILFKAYGEISGINKRVQNIEKNLEDRFNMLEQRLLGKVEQRVADTLNTLESKLSTTISTLEKNAFGELHTIEEEIDQECNFCKGLKEWLRSWGF